MAWLTLGTILLTAIITNIIAYFFQWLRHESIQDQRYNNTLSLLRDETTFIADQIPAFDPTKLQVLNPIIMLAPDILISDFFHRLNKDQRLLQVVSNLRISVNNHNHFLSVYNEIVLNNPDNVDIRERRHKNSIQYYVKVVADKIKLLQYLKESRIVI